VIVPAFVNCRILFASLDATVYAVAVELVSVFVTWVALIAIALRSTLRVTSPDDPPPVSAVPAVTAVMSPGFDTPVQALPFQ